MGDPTHRNNFGLLRLSFALCVLVSHSFELVDGNRSREPLTYLFGTISLGELGVAGFFIVSGYLIAQSLENSTSLRSYFWKRLLRIYPAFVVAFALCIFVVGPLSGADMNAVTAAGWAKQFLEMLKLDMPDLPGAFAGLHYPALNGSMWTIAYEFRCYLLLAVLGAVGLLRLRWLLLSLTLIMLLFEAFHDFGDRAPLAYLIGLPKDALRLTALFLAGSLFYSFRDSVAYGTGRVASMVALALIVCLFNSTTATLALPVLGGYLIFWFAFLDGTPLLNAINNRTDLSYGIYLYAWPVQSLLIKSVPGITPWSVILLTTMATVCLALLSWHFIEAPSLKLKRLKTRPEDPAHAVWHKCLMAPVLGRVEGSEGMGQLWRRKVGGKWQYRRDPETMEDAESRYW